MDKSLIVLAGLLVINAPVYMLIGKIFFGKLDVLGMGNVMVSMCTSPFTRTIKDWMNTLKFFAFLFICAGVVILEWFLIDKFFME